MIPHLQQIWSSGQLTNGGPYHQQLEAELARYLGVPHVALFANATIGLPVLQVERLLAETPVGQLLLSPVLGEKLKQLGVEADQGEGA